MTKKKKKDQKTYNSIQTQHGKLKTEQHVHYLKLGVISDASEG